MNGFKTPCAFALALLVAAGCGGGGGSGEVIVLNPGDGQPVESFRGMDAADLNGDGLVDLVSISDFTDGQGGFERRLSSFLQDPSAPGSFLPREILIADFVATPWTLLAADFRLNGLPGLVVHNAIGGGFAYVEQDPAMPGRFLPPLNFDLPQSADTIVEAIDIADIDGDLYPDIVTTSGDDVWLFRQDPMQPGSFETGVRVAEGANVVRASDISGDGVRDLVAFRESPHEDVGEIADTFVYSVQDPSQPLTFMPPADAVFFDSVGWDIGVADFDGNTLPDIAISSSKGGGSDITAFLHIYLQVGVGQFVNDQVIATSGDIISGEQAIADLDGDGDVEVVVAYRNSAVLANKFEIFERNASGDFVSTAMITLPTDTAVSPQELYALRIADLNADGFPDIVISTNEIFVAFQRNDAPGVFESPVVVAAQR